MSGLIISEEMEKRFEALRDTKKVVRDPFTPEMDAALLKYWNTKNKQEVADTLGVCYAVALRRYRELSSAGE